MKKWWRRKTIRWRVRRQLNIMQHDKNLEDAEAHVKELKERSDLVASYLEPRHRRNHWTEAIQSIARGE